MRCFLGAFLVCTAVVSPALSADPPAGKVRVPLAPSVPSPMPNPEAAITLTPELVLCVDSDCDCVVVCSPKGKLKITPAKGPVTVRGKFVDGNGTVEMRTFAGPFVWFVEAQEPGECELLVLPVGGKEADLLRRRIVSQTGPQPPPKPDDPVDPPKPVEKSPWDNAPGLRVLIVYPRHGALTPDQQAIVTGKRVRDFLDANTVKEGEDTQYRIWKTGEDVAGAAAGWQKAYATVKGDRWVVIGNGPKWTAEPLPADPDKMLELLGRYK